MRLNSEKKEQLLNRVKQCLDEDALDLSDWMKMYDIMLSACERKKNELFEDFMVESFEGDEKG